MAVRSKPSGSDVKAMLADFARASHIGLVQALHAVIRLACTALYTATLERTLTRNP